MEEMIVDGLVSTDHWIKDRERKECAVCTKRFTTLRRKHHCRTCGEVVCHGCFEKRKVLVRKWNATKLVKSCMLCVMKATDDAREVKCAEKENQMDSGFLESSSNSTLSAFDGNFTNQSGEPMFDMLVSIVQKSFDSTYAVIVVQDALTDTFMVKACAGCKRMEINEFLPPCLYTMKCDGETVLPTPTSPVNMQVGKTRVTFFAGYPIKMHGQTIGVVCALDDRVRDGGATEKQLYTLKSVANMTGKNMEMRLTNQTIPMQMRTKQENDVDDDVQSMGSSFYKSNVDRNSHRGESQVTYVIPTLPVQYRNVLQKATNDFQALMEFQKWSLYANVNTILLSCAMIKKKSFVKTSFMVEHHFRAVWAQLVNLDHNMYAEWITKTANVDTLNEQTKKLHVNFASGEQGSLLMHWRVNRDKSIVVLYVKAEESPLTNKENVVLGWHLSVSEKTSLVNITAIAPCDQANHSSDLNRLCKFSKMLQSSLENIMVAPFVAAGPLKNPTHDVNVFEEAIRSSQNAPKSSVKLISVKASTITDSNGLPRSSNTSYTSQSNANQVVLDLLNRALETQEQIASQQHSMLATVGSHTTKISKLVESVDRIEKILAVHNLDLSKTKNTTSKNCNKAENIQDEQDIIEVQVLQSPANVLSDTPQQRMSENTKTNGFGNNSHVNSFDSFASSHEASARTPAVSPSAMTKSMSDDVDSNATPRVSSVSNASSITLLEDPDVKSNVPSQSSDFAAWRQFGRNNISSQQSTRSDIFVTALDEPLSQSSSTVAARVSSLEEKSMRYGLPDFLCRPRARSERSHSVPYSESALAEKVRAIYDKQMQIKETFIRTSSHE